MKSWGKVLGVLASLCAAPLGAQVLEPLRPAEAALFAAVGVVNGAGPLGDAGCSGTLIAPDLVLTAAHCVGDGTGTRWFMPGGLGPRARAAVPSRAIHVHPDYADHEGMARFAVDLALLQLAAPLSAAIAAPLPLTAAGTDGIDRLAVIGFVRGGTMAPVGRFDCPRRQGGGTQQMVLGCPVVSGNSGGPALLRSAGGWQIAGVLVGRLGVGETSAALTAPLDPWLRGLVARLTIASQEG